MLSSTVLSAILFIFNGVHLALVLLRQHSIRRRRHPRRFEFHLTLLHILVLLVSVLLSITSTVASSYTPSTRPHRLALYIAFNLYIHCAFLQTWIVLQWIVQTIIHRVKDTRNTPRNLLLSGTIIMATVLWIGGYAADVGIQIWWRERRGQPAWWSRESWEIMNAVHTAQLGMVAASLFALKVRLSWKGRWIAAGAATAGATAVGVVKLLVVGGLVGDWAWKGIWENRLCEGVEILCMAVAGTVPEIQWRKRKRTELGDMNGAGGGEVISHVRI